MALAQPRFEQSGELHVAGLSRRYPRDDFSLVPDQWNMLITQLQFITGRVGSHTYGLWFDVLKGGPMLYVAGVSVGAFAPINPAHSYYMIAPQQYAVFRHQGGVQDIRATVDAVFTQWLPKSGYEHYRQNDVAPDFFERYAEAAGGGKVGEIEVWVPVRKK